VVSPHSFRGFRARKYGRWEEDTGSNRLDYLKTLAISRLYLDNSITSSRVGSQPGIKICQVGLQFGADDVGSILIEENVVYAAGFAIDE